ncbi:hypothetical protein CSA37_01135 [Candidatus Fermentibacteria bacterium]|nr:MAG: hypothetical protein CSA37_01135 [Candidatus Fermentibacteria bacterium]
MRYFKLLCLFLPCALSAEALILRTEDGGITWQREESRCFNSLNAVAADMITDLMIAVGERGTILLRDASGVWQDVSPAGLTADLNSVAIAVNGLCMVCGDDGTLLSSFDRGESWRLWDEFDCGGVDLLSVNFAPTSPDLFVITGDDGFTRFSEDWSIQFIDSEPIVGSCFRLCSGAPEFIASASGRMVSDDAVAGETGFPVRGVTPVVSGGSHPFLVGEDGMMSTVNGSAREVVPGLSADLKSVSALTWGSDCCAVGEGGTILVSHDNGSDWELLTGIALRDLNGVCSNGSGTGCIVGDTVLDRILP